MWQDNKASQNVGLSRSAQLLGHLLAEDGSGGVLLRVGTSAGEGQSPKPAPPKGAAAKSIPLMNMRDFVDYDIRTYRIKDDDALYHELDKLCAQGVNTKLVTDFPLTHPFEEVQPTGFCVVAVHKGHMVGIIRSYTYECLVNGSPAVVSYLFLARVHPAHRRKNLMAYLVNMYYFHDITCDETDYFTLWVVADNVASLALQDKFTNLAGERHGLPAPDLMETYICLGLTLDDFFSFRSGDDNQNLYLEQVPTNQEVALLQRVHADKQFLSLDLDRLVAYSLHLGTFVLRDRGQGGEIVAGVSGWNSGEIKVTTIGEYSSKDAFLLYNAWHQDSPNGRHLFRILAERVSASLQTKGFKFFFSFFSDRDLKDYNALLRPKAKINAAWRPRVYYQSNTKRVNIEKSIFYDPRQCLI